MVKECKLFEGLSEKETQTLLSFFKQKHFERKQAIKFSEPSQDFIFIVSSGRVKVSYLSPDGKEIIVTILHPGDIYSLHSEATNTVLESATVLYIDTESFNRIALHDMRLMANLLKILGAILKNTNDALLNLAFKEVNSRLASLLLKMVSEKGQRAGTDIIFEMELTHEEIAHLISSTRQTVTTIINRFEKTGLIKTNKRQIIVCNIDKLKELSQ